MICRALDGGPCKTYLLASEKTHQAVLVDPLLERAEAALELLRREGLTLTHVVDTHTHADHLSGCAALRDRASAECVMHARTRAQWVTRRVQEGETLALGEVTARFMYTPGHSADSLSVLVGDSLLTGDFLFLGPDGAGRLDLPGADVAAHFASLRRLDALPGGVEVLPGHDYSGGGRSALEAQRRVNPVLAPRGRDEYLSWWSQRRGGPSDWMRAVVEENLRGPRDANAVAIPKAGAACACATAPGHAETDAPPLSAADLAAMIGRDPKGVVLLDVRAPQEYCDELGHIAGAVPIPVDELADRAGEVPPGPVVSICRSGKRAARAAGVLKKAGRAQVWVLTGGMLAWNEAGLPVER